MSQSTSQAIIFYKEVATKRTLWTIRDSGSFPAPKNSEGERVQPFWSSLSRVQKIIETVPAYAGFEPFDISWSDFTARWVPGLEKDRVLVGVNWSGYRATGYDIAASKVKEYIESYIHITKT